MIAYSSRSYIKPFDSSITVKISFLILIIEPVFLFLWNVLMYNIVQSTEKITKVSLHTIPN